MNTFRFGVLLLAGALLAPLPASALGLVDSFEAALRLDPDLAAAQEALVAGREKTVQGRALLLPKVNLRASLSQVDNESTTDLPPAFSDLIKSDSNGSVHETELRLKQPLWDAEAFAGRRQLREQSALAAIRFSAAEQDLVERVGETYLAVLLAQDSLRVVQAEKAAMHMQRDRAQARFELGRGRITDVQEAQARYDAVLAREVSSQSTLALREAQYEELTGAPARALPGLRNDFTPTSLDPVDLASWQSRGLDHHPRVLTQRAELAVAQAEMGKYRLSARPTLDLVASYTHQGQDGGLSPAIASDRSDTTVVGLQLEVPLFAGGALQSKLREAEASERQARHQLAGAQRDTRLQVQDAWLSLSSSIARVHSLAQSALSARTALDATVAGRDQGTRTELDVLDSQQHAYATELDLAQGRHDYLLGRLRLVSAAGELERADLEQLEAFLLPPSAL